jgi:hypothetical protein
MRRCTEAAGSSPRPRVGQEGQAALKEEDAELKPVGDQTDGAT